MNTPRQPFVGLALVAVLGITVADFFPIAVSHWWTVAIVFALLAIPLFVWPTLGSTYLFIGAGFFVLHNFRTGDTRGLQLAIDLSERPRVVNAVGFVTSEPKIAPNEFATFLFKLESIELEGKTASTNATLLVRWRGSPEFGDELKLSGMAEPIAPPRNPGEFDMRSYLVRQDVRRTLSVRYPEDGLLVRKRAGNPILRAAQKSRAWMQTAICRGLDDSLEVQNFLSGIVLGLRHQTTEDIEEAFQQTGTLHLFAVAGLHVGIVARLLWILATVARLSRKWGTALIIPLLLFYAAVTGLHVSSIRAAVMSSILLGGFFFERKVFSLNSLAAAAFLILLFDSNQLFTSGFQLSFAVVGTIVLLADPMRARFERIVAPDPFLPRLLLSRMRRIYAAVGRGLARGASVSLAAWIGSLLLIYWYFYLITPISLLANLVVVPIAYFVLALAMLSLMAAPISSALSILFNNANWLMSRAVLGLVHFFAMLPAGHVYLARFTERHAPITITVLDEGTGGAAHIRTNNYDWLIDCGSQRNYERTLKSFLHSRGINRIEGILLTHGDAQHIGCAGDTVADFAPHEIYDNPLDVRSAVQRRF